MRMFNDGDTITIESVQVFPVVKDLVVDRSAFDRIQHAGGFVGVNLHPIDANIPINKRIVGLCFDAATCIIVVSRTLQRCFVCEWRIPAFCTCRI
jgi:succinate dehydrogenase / fumarate reductase iron-sulfur subunit